MDRRMLAQLCIGAIVARHAQAALTTYTYSGAVTNLGGSGNVLGVQANLNDGVSGTLVVDSGNAFITGSSGIQPSSNWGGGLTASLNGSTFSALVYQCTANQQASPGVNIVELFPVGNSMLVDSVAAGNFGSFYLHLVFLAPAFPNGSLPDLTTYTLDPTLSFGRVLEFNGGGSDSFDFSIVQVTPAPGALGVLATSALLAIRRRRR